MSMSQCAGPCSALTLMVQHGLCAQWAPCLSVQEGGVLRRNDGGWVTCRLQGRTGFYVTTWHACHHVLKPHPAIL